MFTFLIIADVDNIFTTVHQAFSVIGTPENQINGRLVVEAKGGMKEGWIAFQPIANPQFDYEIDELEEIKKQITNPSFYLVEGRNGAINLSNKFIQNFRPLGKVLIDNDHGMVTDLAKVKRKIELGENWLYCPAPFNRPNQQ